MSTAPLIVGLGEILWDVFPDAKHFGGAPANFAVHGAALGNRVKIVSAIGEDALGDEALAVLHGLKMDDVYVQRSSHPTGRVTVNLDAAGKADYSFAPDVAWDHLKWSDSVGKLARAADAVCFGTLAQRSKESEAFIQQFLGQTRSDCLRIFDVNLRQQFFSQDQIRRSLELANVLKLNDEELDTVAGNDFGRATDDQLRGVRERYDLDLVAMTRGHKGAILIGREGECDFPGIATELVDTVGAGDAFTAVLAAGLLQCKPLELINRRACEVAAYVCSQAGATPALPAHLSRPFTA